MNQYNRLIPAVFLDRDGTIIEDRGDLSRPSQVVFFDETISSLRQLSEYFKFFIVTNQSGVAKGTLSLRDVENVNAYIASVLARQGIEITDTYVCQHMRSDNCECIKPKPFFLKKAEKEHGIALSQSFVIGDHPHDIEFAENVGAKGIYVLSGHGMKHRDELPPNSLTASGIAEAAKLIMETLPVV